MRLTIERLFADPALSGRLPTQVRFSPDSASVTFLAVADDDRERLDLHRYDIESGATTVLVDARSLGVSSGPLTEAEKAERERKRFFSEGISDYQWHPHGHELLIVSGGRAYLRSLDAAGCRLVTPPDTRQTDIRYSGSGAHLSYVRDGDLYIYDIAAGRERRLTFDGSETVANGIADFIAQEEMHRFDGHWWAHDDTWLLATRVDSSRIPITHRYEIAADAFTVHPQRYPFAGAANADVALQLIDIASGACRTVEFRRDEEDYLARVTAGNASFALLVQSRDQSRVQLTRYRVAALSPESIAEDRWRTWLNLSSDPRFIPGTDDLVWLSERDGRARVYRSEGADVRALSPARGRAGRLVHVTHEHVYFAGWLDEPTEQHVYRIALSGDQCDQLTSEPGWHDATVAADGGFLAAQFSNRATPPRLDLVHAETRALRTIAGDFSATHPYTPYLEEHSAPELGTLRAADGQTLHYRMVRPKGFDSTRRYPVLLDVYGGPGVQRVRNDWAPLAWQLFAQAGFVVFQLDNRGSGNRDKVFEDPLWHRLGDVEAVDQLRGVEFLASQPWVDAQHIGIMGHSYGGYLTLKCLARSPGTFRAGVAGAPVTDWALYDTHYTERYLGTPQANPAGYRDSTVFEGIDRLVDPLLIIHGMADDNVLFTHSTLLFKALQDRGVTFEMMTYPGAKHALQQRPVAIHRLKTILDFFQRHLHP
jgi:dipeptidyl-peptidase-4